MVLVAIFDNLLLTVESFVTELLQSSLYIFNELFLCIEDSGCFVNKTFIVCIYAAEFIYGIIVQLISTSRKQFLVASA